MFFFFFKQKTAYEMRISDWSSDVCSSDLRRTRRAGKCGSPRATSRGRWPSWSPGGCRAGNRSRWARSSRSEEHTSELQSLMRISYAVFCLKKKNKIRNSYRHLHSISLNSIFCASYTTHLNMIQSRLAITTQTVTHQT